MPALTPGKKSPVPIGKEGGCAPEPVWMTWRRENSLPYRDSNSDPSAVQLVSIPTALSLLLAELLVALLNRAEKYEVRIVS
jgi:hypothetical protein